MGNKWEWDSWVFYIVSLLAVAMTLLAAGLDIGYRDWQIDYANGVIQYRLVKQSDGSTRWERVAK